MTAIVTYSIFVVRYESNDTYKVAKKWVYNKNCILKDESAPKKLRNPSVISFGMIFPD